MTGKRTTDGRPPDQAWYAGKRGGEHEAMWRNRHSADRCRLEDRGGALACRTCHEVYVYEDRLDSDMSEEIALDSDMSKEIAQAIAEAGREIGKEGASGMGAIEGLGKCVVDAGDAIAAAIMNARQSVEVEHPVDVKIELGYEERDILHSIATALTKIADKAIT